MNEKILIVDSESHILESLEKIMNEFGFRVMCAFEGSDAVRTFQTETPDLVIMELRIPETDCLELLRLFKKMDDDVEVIVLTGSATIEDIIRMMRAGGAFDLLTKPLKNIDQLFSSIEDALKYRAARREIKAQLSELQLMNRELMVRLKQITAAPPGYSRNSLPEGAAEPGRGEV